MTIPVQSGPTATLPGVSAADVVTITQEVWASFLGLALAETAPAPSAFEGRTTMTGSVHITGTWQGTVMLRCSSDFASAAAAAMFGSDASELSDDEVSDALGELTNMVGGNIKSLLPAPSALSMPSVIGGGDYVLRVPGETLVDEVTLDCEGEVLHVAVWSK